MRKLNPNDKVELNEKEQERLKDGETVKLKKKGKIIEYERNEADN